MGKSREPIEKEKSKNKVLMSAQGLFFSRGYKNTSLQEIADELSIKPASLYYHFPDGKEQIYLGVLKMRLDEYRTQVEDLLKTHPEIDDFLLAFASWYIEQPTMNMEIISQMDMPFLTPRSRKQIMELVGQSIFAPLRIAFANSQKRLQSIDPMRMVGIYITMLNGMSNAIKQGYVSREKLADEFVKVMLYGILKK